MKTRKNKAVMVSSTTLHHNARQVVDTALEGSPVVVTLNNRPLVVVLSYSDYQQMLASQEKSLTKSLAT